LIIAWAGIFVTDYVRCGSLQAPIFTAASDTVDDYGSGKYYGLGYTVYIRMLLDEEHGVTIKSIESVEMSVLGKVISAAIQLNEHDLLELDWYRAYSFCASVKCCF